MKSNVKKIDPIINFTGNPVLIYKKLQSLIQQSQKLDKHLNYPGYLIIIYLAYQVNIDIK